MNEARGSLEDPYHPLDTASPPHQGVTVLKSIEWRRRFPTPPHHSSYFVASSPMPAEALSVRSMNFGQHWRTPGIVEVPYAIVLPGAYAVALLSRDWNEFVSDCQRFPEPDDPCDRALRALGWPEPAQALANPIAAPPVLDFFAHEFLLRWFGDGSSDATRFVLNTLDEVRMTGPDVYLAGRARSHDPGVPYAYQDV